MASTVSLKNSTLNTQANELALPEGSLKEAKNVVIDRDDTVQSRRGFKEYGGTTASAAKQLLVYKERILQHYGSSLRVDDGNGVFANISGSYPEVEAGLRIKGLEANSNFYFTTSTGIKKIVAQSASDLNASTVVETTGTPAGIDLEGTTNYNSDNPPFLTGDSAVAYRVVWGKKDGNDNLLLGAPSQRTVVTNSLLTQLNLDFDSITKLMDFFGYQGSLFSSVDYFSSYDSRERDVHGLTEALYNITTSGSSNDSLIEESPILLSTMSSAFSKPSLRPSGESEATVTFLRPPFKRSAISPAIVSRRSLTTDILACFSISPNSLPSCFFFLRSIIILSFSISTSIFSC